jgi:hypothetical protein
MGPRSKAVYDALQMSGPIDTHGVARLVGVSQYSARSALRILEAEHRITRHPASTAQKIIWEALTGRLYFAKLAEAAVLLSTYYRTIEQEETLSQLLMEDSVRWKRVAEGTRVATSGNNNGNGGTPTRS